MRVHVVGVGVDVGVGVTESVAELLELHEFVGLLAVQCAIGSQCLYVGVCARSAPGGAQSGQCRRKAHQLDSVVHEGAEVAGDLYDPVVLLG